MLVYQRVVFITFLGTNKKVLTHGRRSPCPVKALGRMRTQQETPKTASATNGAFTNNQRFSLETGASLELFGYVAT